MSSYSPDIGPRIAEARRAKGLTQSKLAQAAGCTQSAVSMFEKGDATKVADATIVKMAELLGVELKAKNKAAALPTKPTSPHTRGYCPNCGCPSNVPYVVDDRVIFRPLRETAAPNGGARCVVCGEVLETCCPSCGAPLNDGACCAVCGQPYVTCILPEGADPENWARARRAEIRELRELAALR